MHVFPSYFAVFRIPSERVLINIVTTLSKTFRSGFCTWKLEQISRDLLDPFQNVFGSAVLSIADVFSGGIETPRNISSMDISNAVVVCDIRIEKTTILQSTDFPNCGVHYCKPPSHTHNPR